MTQGMEEVRVPGSVGGPEPRMGPPCWWAFSCRFSGVRPADGFLLQLPISSSVHLGDDTSWFK